MINKIVNGMRKEVSVSTLTFSSPNAESKPAETIISSGLNWKIIKKKRKVNKFV